MEHSDQRGIYKLFPNRVRRNYMGGAGIDRLQHHAVCEDTQQPEEWVASLVEAKNPGMPPVPQEGLSSVADRNGNRIFLKDLIETDPIYFLGEQHYARYGVDLRFLYKILDSSMRLHLQAHPTAAFSQQYLNSPYGKLECYYVLAVREGISPYIRLGFQKSISRQEWKRIIEQQDIDAMDSCFEKIPVQPGEVWLVEGGLPHAIGEGILLLEIMEPSDLVVRCEFEREGIVVPSEARYMGKDLDFCLSIFDYQVYTPEQIREKFCLQPKTIYQEPSCTMEQLISGTRTSCFTAFLLHLDGSGKIPVSGFFAAGVVCQGSVKLRCGEHETVFGSGESFFLAAHAEEVFFEGKAEICLVTAYSDQLEQISG